jgi:hypothetical protein
MTFLPNTNTNTKHLVMVLRSNDSWAPCRRWMPMEANANSLGVVRNTNTNTSIGAQYFRNDGLTLCSMSRSN